MFLNKLWCLKTYNNLITAISVLISSILTASLRILRFLNSEPLKLLNSELSVNLLITVTALRYGIFYIFDMFFKQFSILYSPTIVLDSLKILNTSNFSKNNKPGYIKVLVKKCVRRPNCGAYKVYWRCALLGIIPASTIWIVEANMYNL